MEFDQERFDAEMAEFKGGLPKAVVVPEKLSAASRIRFRCYPGIGCFTKCCRNIRIILTPYDIFRLKNRLGLSYRDFLLEYAAPDTVDGSSLPVVALKMGNDAERSCPFVRPDGCSVYTDRPVICRYYPVGMGIMKKFDRKSGEDFFLMIREDHCLGHNEEKEWTVDEWRSDQESDLYDTMNSDWMEVVLKAKTLGMVNFSQRSLELFHIVSTNLDLFREFFFSGGLADTYALDEALLSTIREDELELLKFSLKWLRFILFGEGDFPIRAKAKRQARKKGQGPKGPKP